MINWLVTDMHFAFILIILLLIFFVISFVSSHDPSKPLTTLISGIAFIITFIVMIVTATLTKIVPESSHSWTQIYTNSANASVMIDYGDNHKITAGDILGTHGKDYLHNKSDESATVIVKNGEDESQRKVIVNRIDSYVSENSAITKIEYRPTPTFHYQLFGINGHSQTSNFDGEIRITIKPKTNSANTIFGDK